MLTSDPRYQPHNRWRCRSRAFLVPLLGLANQARHQGRHQRGPKVVLDAAEVVSIDKGKARATHGSGAKASPAGLDPGDGHTLGPIIADLEKLTGVETRQTHVDKEYRGRNHPNKFWVSIRLGPPGHPAV